MAVPTVSQFQRSNRAGRVSEQCLTSPPTRYRLSGRQFYSSKDQTNSIKVMKETLFLDIHKLLTELIIIKCICRFLQRGFQWLLLTFCATGTVNLYYAVRWNSQISEYFAVNSGVRQGSFLSPAIFNVFMNVFITQLKSLGIGCCISSMYIVCWWYLATEPNCYRLTEHVI